MIKHLYYILKLMRPRQWTKNIALFAAITLGGKLGNIDTLITVISSFFAFCLLSSTTYIINDIFDVNKDRLHPFKRSRPIAAGTISIAEAVVLVIIFLAVSLFVAASIDPIFFLISLIYIVLQLAYSYIFKALAVFDIVFIAVGFILRVLAGEVISGYHISVWLLLTTISLSLFLAVGKRRSELTLLRNLKTTKIEEVRKALSHYSETLLDAFSTMFVTSTFIFYSMFTYYEKQATKPMWQIFMPEYLPDDLERKWLMITIAPVVYGLMRYMQDIYERNEGESPERIILSDKPLLISVLIWVVLVLIIIY